MSPEDRTHRNIAASGRLRSEDEQLFTAALVAELDRERERRGLDDRGLAELLNVHPSLLSMYRNGQRLPSIPGFIDFNRVFPYFFSRVVIQFERLVRRRDTVTLKDDEDDPTKELGGPPAERVGSYDLSTLLR